MARGDGSGRIDRLDRDAEVLRVQRVEGVRLAWWGPVTGNVWAIGERDGIWYLLELAEGGVLEVVSCLS